VGNAAKFTDEGEIRVEVGWDAEPHTLKITVSDTGCGIAEAKMERLFDPFVQDIASRMKANAGEMKGTGLGLPIVKRMVDNAHGTVKADSALGKGTSFEIVIPGLDIAEGVSTAARSAEETLRSAMPERVLVVDDMAMNRKILGIHLGNLKVKDIRYAENGEAKYLINSRMFAIGSLVLGILSVVLLPFSFYIGSAIFGAIGMFLGGYTQSFVRVTGVKDEKKKVFMGIAIVGLAVSVIGFMFGFAHLF
jgi:hypothetical protein